MTTDSFLVSREKKPRRCKWLRWVLAILLAPIVASVMVCKIIFVANDIPKDRLAPPADLVQIKPRPGAKALLSLSNPYMNYEDFIRAKDPQSQVIEIYSNWNRRFEAESQGYRQVWGEWKSGQPLSEPQKHWLESHQSLIDDLMKIAAAGGLPQVTCEDVVGSGQEDLLYISLPDNLYFFARLLAHDSRRRRELGDERGAAETLLAIGSIANTSAEPDLSGYFFSISVIRNMRDVELSDWIAAAPPKPEVARLLRDRLAATSDSQPLDFHRQLELEYRTQRQSLISTLRLSYAQMFAHEYNLNHSGITMGVDVWYLLDQLVARPIDTVQDCSSMAMKSFGDKSHAKATLDEFDAIWANVLKKPTGAIDSTVCTDLAIGMSNLRTWTHYSQFENFSEMADHVTRARATQACESINLVALDFVLQSAGEARRPPRIDPFTHAPLKIAEQTTTTLIYSVGPDKNDQHGALVYDPTNGRISGGDILVRVPLKIK